jgi:hypothetical protein
MDANFGSQYGSSVIYVTTFKSKPDELVIRGSIGASA